MSKTYFIGPDHKLTLEVTHAVAHGHAKIKLSTEATRRIKASRLLVERMIKQKKVVYGVTTGFGNFKDRSISPDDVEDLQRNLIRSHAVGVGRLLSVEQV